MNFRAVASLALISFASAAFAATPSNDFTLLGASGKPVGKASFSIDKNKNGYKVRSHFEYHLGADDRFVPPGMDPTQAGGGAASRSTEAQYSFEYNADANGNYLSGYTRDSATQLMTSLQPDKTRTNINISGMQGGQQTGVRTLGLPKPDFLVAPDFDPSAIQMLLTSAAVHPHADSTYLLIVPMSPDRGPSAANEADYVILQPTSDVQGTLDGKSITLKHFLLNYHTGSADIYTDADGNLMQATLTPIHATYVRNKFELAK